ncbi:helix-turn-helix domain-containing protein [Promicromonospora sp. NPDC057138]|uniref:helix-turn-helix domain-containing protein n=1 Tax=Promicromonospora sp. NPDC057138 TaxID=3346031 RepID=UPI00363E9C8A
MEDEDSIGRRIAFYRKQRGLTQIALAQKASVSVSLLRKIEQGARDATPVLVAAVAKPLGVDVTVLNGQPYDREGPGRDRIHELIPAVRAMLNYWDLPPDLETPTRPADQLIIEAVAIAHLRQADRNVEALSRIPAVLLEITAALYATDVPSEQETLHDAAATVLHPALSILHATGYDDLATITAARITWVGDRWGSPLVAALAVHTRTSSMLRYGTYDVGLRLTERARADLATEGTDADALRMTGSLHLRSAILAARAGDADLAAQHITEARAITDRLPQDTDHLWRNLAFGPTNTGFHDVATAIELGDGPRALTLAEGLDVPATFARTRTAHHFMDLARAYLWQGRYDASLACLQRSRELAPQQTRHHPTTREVTRMLVRAHRHTNEPLARFTAWMTVN